MVVSGLCNKTLELNNRPWSSAGCWIFVGFFYLVFSLLRFFFSTMLVFFIVNTRSCACTLHQQNILVNIFWSSEVICVKYWVSAFHSAGESREMAAHWRSIDFQHMSLELHYQAWHQVCLNPSFHILWRGEREMSAVKPPSVQSSHIWSQECQGIAVLPSSDPWSKENGDAILPAICCLWHLLGWRMAMEMCPLAPGTTGVSLSSLMIGSCWFSFHFLPLGTQCGGEKFAGFALAKWALVGWILQGLRR